MITQTASTASPSIPTGRFAPSPTGRMHLGNLYTAVMSWLSVKSRGGKWILRIEDLDNGRSRPQFASLIESDLLRLGLEWDEGGTDSIGTHGPYRQSERSDIYQYYYNLLVDSGLTYRCRCTRADIMATQAPHLSDGRVVYSGACRPKRLGGVADESCSGATRLFVPDRDIVVDDIVAGRHSYNLASDCGDFVIRRADGAWAYQLAVVVDDALMGVTQVVRGNDLLLSAAQQAYLYELLGFAPPRWFHLPLMVNSRGVRLSKRDASLGADRLFADYTPGEILAIIGNAAGIVESCRCVTLEQLIERFDLKRLSGRKQIIVNDC